MRPRDPLLRFGFLAIALLVYPATARASWPTTAVSDSVALCVAPGALARMYSAVPDGFGGAIATWVDHRAVGVDGPRVYAQRIRANGDPVWPADGLLIRRSVTDAAWATCIPDTVGGMYVAWFDSAQAAVVAQHVDSTGALLWGLNGVRVNDDVLISGYPQLVMSTIANDRGLYVAFGARTATTRTVRLQYLAPSGVRQLGVNALTLGNTAQLIIADQLRPLRVFLMNFFSPVVMWGDNGAGKIMAQEVSMGLHAPVWTAGGVSLVPGTVTSFPDFAPAAPLGAYFTYTAQDVSSRYTVFAQHMDDLGAATWPGAGIALAPSSANLEFGTAVLDSAGGAIVGAALSDGSIVMQRLSSAGTKLWNPAGVNVTATVPSFNLELCPADNGTIVAAWRDALDAAHLQSFDIATGTERWAPGGVPVFTSPGTHLPFLQPSPGLGTIMVTTSLRTPSVPDDGNIYAKLVRPDGTLGDPFPTLVAVRDVPADQGGWVYVTWNASPLESRAAQPVTQYRVWWRNDALAGRPYVPVATTPARGFAGYGCTVATSVDSVPGVNHGLGSYTAIRIEAMNAAGSTFSAPDSGFSVDNLPPFAPVPLPTLAGSFGVRVHWLPSEGATSYRLYRGPAPGFTPGRENLLATLADTAYVDPSGIGETYVVIAVDAHGNVSAAVTLPAPGTLGVQPPDIPRELALAAPSPNPMLAGSAATLRFALPTAGPVTLALYDVSGRQVRVLAQGPYKAGSHTVLLDSRGAREGALPGGLYFVRLTAAGATRVRRLVVMP